MDVLPSPALHQICELLWESSRPSLNALSLVNSRCYKATVPFIYRILTISISKPERLKYTVRELVDHSLRQQCLVHTRKLNIKGKMFRSDMKGEPELSGWQLYTVNAALGVGRMASSDLCCSGDELEPKYYPTFISDGYDLLDTETEESRILEAWEPLASLIMKLQFLVELNYACLNQFPSNLLEALHQYQPRCKLNLKIFRFHGLPEISSSELKLIRSPCLHELTVRYSLRDTNGREDFNDEAIMEIAAIAPNIKVIKLQYCHPMSSSPIHGRRLAPREGSWKGFMPSLSLEEKSRSKGNLSCLLLPLIMFPPTENTLSQWGPVTDLSKLRSLNTGRMGQPSDLTRALEIGPFKSLKKLSINLFLSYEEAHVRFAIESFFENLGPLTTLRLTGTMDMALVHAILERQGPSLQELSVLHYQGEMTITAADISSFAQCCPQIRELGLIIERSTGDRHETACYEALSKFRWLEKLSLELDCLDPDLTLQNVNAIEESLDDFYNQMYITANAYAIRNVQVRDMIVNAAVDEKLARSIWGVVTSRRHRLSYLKVKTRGVNNFRILSSHRFKISDITREFEITRESWRSDHDSIKVVETGGNSKRDDDEKQRQHDAQMLSIERSDREEITCEDEIMERIWPESVENPGWRYWSSWPLTPSS
ncbi:hypothetical protein FQN54_001449 [Arachnomyces sp. PD_36]|nr:hypothetical protein FQN54_001449 [Arachnomyces sp. PD_36]